jgi:peptidoglycan DL-endopeptidase CwlO
MSGHRPDIMHARSVAVGGLTAAGRRRVLPTMIAVALTGTLIADIAVLHSGLPADRPASAGNGMRLVAEVSQANPVPVAPLHKRVTPHMLVAAPTTLPAEAIEKVRRTRGVTAIEVVDAAQAKVNGKNAGLLAVNPSTFRAYTPKPTAESDPLWRNIAAGDVAVSFVMGNDGGLPLGRPVPVGGQRSQAPVRLGAYATMGISEVDAIVSRETGRRLSMPSGNALLVSAPKADLVKLRKALGKALPKGTKRAILNPDVRLPGGPARGRVMNLSQIRFAIKAAQTKLGVPYVWGGESDAEGGYDCSGLVQWAFAQAGVRMPRVAADQARTGWIIPFDKARPGDLLIWAHDPTAPGYISHIAIYLGAGKMIVAPRTGDVVKIAPVTFRNFKGAVRVNPQIAARLA